MFLNVWTITVQYPNAFGITMRQRRAEVISEFVCNPFPNKLWILRVCSTSLLKTLWEKEKYKSFENTVGKGEIARNERFQPVWRTCGDFHKILNCRLQSL